MQTMADVGRSAELNVDKMSYDEFLSLWNGTSTGKRSLESECNPWQNYKNVQHLSRKDLVLAI